MFLRERQPVLHRQLRIGRKIMRDENPPEVNFTARRADPFALVGLDDQHRAGGRVADRFGLRRERITIRSAPCSPAARLIAVAGSPSMRTPSQSAGGECATPV